MVLQLIINFIYIGYVQDASGQGIAVTVFSVLLSVLSIAVNCFTIYYYVVVKDITPRRPSVTEDVSDFVAMARGSIKKNTKTTKATTTATTSYPAAAAGVDTSERAGTVVFFDTGGQNDAQNNGTKGRDDGGKLPAAGTTPAARADDVDNSEPVPNAGFDDGYLEVPGASPNDDDDAGEGAQHKHTEVGGMMVERYETWAPNDIDGTGEDEDAFGFSGSAEDSDSDDAADDSGSAVFAKLKELATWKQDGLLTDDEFAAAKAKLLADQ